MKKLVWLALLIAIPAIAQQPSAPADPLTAREAMAQKRASEWETLAKGLEARISRMLPCDPRLKAAIEEVSHASEARLSSLTDYLQAAAAEAASDAERARKAVDDAGGAAKEIEPERAEAEQQRVALDGQIADLSESARRRPSLDDAAAKLQAIQAMTVARIARFEPEIARRAALRQALADLATAYDARKTAIDTELAALTEETARWADYYASKLARAATECSVTNQIRPSRKKQ